MNDGGVDSPLCCNPFKGSTVEVSILNGGIFDIGSQNVILNPLRTRICAKKILFGLGFTRAWKEKQPPVILGQIEFAKPTVRVEKDIAEQLTEANIPLESINSIIWSHHHIGHTGDPFLFPKSVRLVVGPGFKSDNTLFPGYPKNPNAVTVDDAFEGHWVILSPDFFSDGRFYLLAAPGHTHDHICGFARTSKDEFFFLGGDIAHHACEFRLTTYLPLPAEINPSPFDLPTCVDKMECFGASLHVFVIIAHIASVLGVLPLFPRTITTWDRTDEKIISRWRFLKGF
ncbi:hypothetical protein OIDMADRAFT_37341 [Oidiodendron maius Zn]|uniref:Metallo-beta-lactamase domain-containing protein n=1 Tax=Oidiodendron maius (strain Zn) TaxID=913774 RepID=A0A0C3HIK9_OIDMZ|nr:hypothetical protein OIDMADRAFT_37341 [Oidiodendron maius Zn]